MNQQIFECYQCAYKTELEKEIFLCEQCSRYGICIECSLCCDICSIELCSNCVIYQGIEDINSYLCKSCDIEIHNNEDSA
jgi:hypothetical protein